MTMQAALSRERSHPPLCAPFMFVDWPVAVCGRRRFVGGCG
jgi:hypothetical protein